jgi:MFS transporter, OFA family, oxalate/formate antiporter
MSKDNKILVCQPMGNHRIGPVFWGWYVVFSSFIMLTLIYGARYSFGVFVKPMFAEYNWPMTVISLAASINMMMYASAGVFVGWLLDRVAPKWIATVSVLLVTAGFIAASFVKTPLGFYLSYGLLVGVGSAGSGAVACTAAVGKWFTKKRGMAIGIATMGIGFGTLIMAPVAGYIVKNFGWRVGFLCIGALICVVGIVMSQIFMGKDNPEHYGLRPDGESMPPKQSNFHPPDKSVEKPSLKPILADPRFWLLVICNTFAVMTVMMTFVHQVAYAINSGIDKIEAAAAIGFIGIMGSCGKFFFGWLCDRVQDAKYSAALGFLLMAIGMFLLYRTTNIVMLYGFALFYGFGYGSLAPVTPYLISDRFGGQILGAIYGLLAFFATGIGGALGPILGGLIFDKTGSYGPGWILNAVCLVIISLLILALKPKPKEE